MKKKGMWKKALCVLLVLCMILAAVPLSASAAGTGVADRLNALRSKYPSGKYWNHYVSKYEENGDYLLANGIETFASSVTSTPCTTHNGRAQVGQYDCNCFDGGIQCWGFANRIFFEVFGIRRSGLGKNYNKSQVTVGDYVRFGSDSNGHSVVVIGRSGNNITVAEANYAVNCQIKWGRTINLDEGDYGKPFGYFCRATNYDQINGSPAPAVADKITLDDPWVGYATDDNAQIGSFIRNGGAAVGATSFGLQVWEKATGTRIVNHSEDISASVQQLTEIKIWNNLTNELGVKLKPGTQYEFQFSAVKGGKTYYSSKSTFTTTGKQTVTLKFSPGEGAGTALTKEVPLGEPFVMPACTFTAPTGKAFSKWWSPAVRSYSAGESMTLDASKYKAGSTIEFTASWEVINPTKLTSYPIVIEKLTPTNLVLSCEVEFANLENIKLDNVYSDLVDHIINIRQGSEPDADGNVKYTQVEQIRVPYTAEELTNGKHKLTIDLNKEGYQLQPGTRYSIEWMFGSTSKSIISRAATLTTPAEDGSATDSPGKYTITGVTAKDGVYNGGAHPGFTGTPAAEGFSGTFSVHYAGRDGTDYDSAQAPKNAGSYTVRFTAEDSGAYGELTLDFVIAKAGITIYADNKNVQAGGVLPELTYTVTGLAKGDSLSAPPQLACTVQPDLTSPATYVIRASGAKVPSGGNYDEEIAYIDGILNVCAGDGQDDGRPVPANLSLDQSEVYLTPGSSTVLKPVTEPADALVDRYIWRSDNERVVRVDADGRVTGVADGRATVRVTTSDGRLSASCAVVVGPWYQRAVDYVQREGLMNGYSNGSFGPNDRLTRAQLAQILYSREKRPSVIITVKFSDVGRGAWYSAAVSWAVDRQIVSGCGNGRFGPDNNISRQDLAVMLWRYAGSPGSSGSVRSFSDASDISGYALNAMQWAVEQEIMCGSGGRLNPGNSASRAEVAQMLMKYLGSQP